MRHAAHKAAKVSNERFSVAEALFTSSRGSHTAKAVRMVQLANGGGAVVGLEPAVAEKLNEVAPMSRRAMREAARVAWSSLRIHGFRIAGCVGWHRGHCHGGRPAECV